MLQGSGTSHQAAAGAAPANASGSSQVQSSSSTGKGENAAIAQQPYMQSNYAPTGSVNSGFQPGPGGGNMRSMH